MVIKKIPSFLRPLQGSAFKSGINNLSISIALNQLNLPFWSALGRWVIPEQSVHETWPQRPSLTFKAFFSHP